MKQTTLPLATMKATFPSTKIIATQSTSILESNCIVNFLLDPRLSVGDHLDELLTGFGLADLQHDDNSEMAMLFARFNVPIHDGSLSDSHQRVYLHVENANPSLDGLDEVPTAPLGLDTELSET